MGPNHWKFFLCHGAAVTVGRGCLDKLSVDLWIKWCFGMYRAGMAVKSGFTK